MRNRYTLIVIWLLADAAWLTTALTLVGWTLAQKASLLPGWLVFLVLSCAFVLGALAPSRTQDGSTVVTGRWRTIQGLAGGAAALLSIEAGPGVAALSAWWPIAIANHEASSVQVIGVVTGLVATLGLWRRGIAAGIEDVSEIAFRSTFLWGTVTVVLAASIDALCGCGLLDQQMVILFFAASLAGLALAQIPALLSDSAGTTAWFRAISIAVIGVLFASFVLQQLNHAFGQTIASFVGEIWHRIVAAIIDILIVIIGPVIVWMVAGLKWLVAALGGSSGGEFSPPNFAAIHELLARRGEFNQQARHVISVLLLALLVLVLYKGFWHRFRNRYFRDPALSFDEREHLEADVNIPDLLLDLLPRWLRRGVRDYASWPYPHDRPGITEAYLLYFAMLEAAMDKRWQFDPCATPRERVHTLCQTLVGAPVAEITECFNLACYAGIPTSPRRLQELEEELLRKRTT